MRMHHENELCFGTVQRTRGASLASIAALVLFAALGCTPGTDDDAGPADGGDETDAGQPPVDAGHDAGQPPNDSGPSGECPTIGPLTNPEGDDCSEEGLICRESGCFAPGPSCLFIECRNGKWVNQALIDSGPLPDDDAGDDDDAGPNDDDAGASDAGSDDDAGADDDAGDDSDAGDAG